MTWASWSGSPSRTSRLRRGAAGERVGEAVLAGLVDDERVELAVELLARVEPGRAGDEQHLGVEHVVELARLHVLALEAGRRT